jgi:very-long-chain ceramide synthase
MPKARLYTSKFLTLSHYNSNTGKYAAGLDDFYFITFYVVLFTGLRAALMEYVLALLARRWGISKKKEATRFSEQGCILTYYTFCCPLGMVCYTSISRALRLRLSLTSSQYIYYQSPYFLNMEELWTDWPQREVDGLMKGYILAEWAYYLKEILVLNIEDRRKDHWQMLTHHFVTIALISVSYAYHQTRVGHLLLMLMDVIDLVFPVSHGKSKDITSY